MIVQLCKGKSCRNIFYQNIQIFRGGNFYELGQSRKASRIVGQGYSQAGTLWGVPNVSLCAFGAQLGLD